MLETVTLQQLKKNGKIRGHVEVCFIIENYLFRNTILCLLPSLSTCYPLSVNAYGVPTCLWQIQQTSKLFLVFN